MKERRGGRERERDRERERETFERNGRGGGKNGREERQSDEGRWKQKEHIETIVSLVLGLDSSVSV